MLEKVFGFLANKCKVEIYSKEEIDEKMLLKSNFKLIEGSVNIQNNSAASIQLDYPERLFG